MCLSVIFVVRKSHRFLLKTLIFKNFTNTKFYVKTLQFPQTAALMSVCGSRTMRVCVCVCVCVCVAPSCVLIGAQRLRQIYRVRVSLHFELEMDENKKVLSVFLLN